MNPGVKMEVKIEKLTPRGLDKFFKVFEEVVHEGFLYYS